MMEDTMPELLLLPVDQPDTNKLEDAYEVARDIEARHDGTIVRVPRHFQFDGASIPSPA